MNLSHYDFETIFEIKPEVINVLVVEDEDKFFCYCNELKSQVDGGDGRFCLSKEEDVILSLGKVSLFCADLFNFSASDKKLSTKLFQYLQNLIEEKFPLEFADLEQKWGALFDKLNAESDCQIDYDDGIDATNFFKSFGVKVFDDAETLVEKIVGAIRAISSLLKIKLFFFVNLKSFLSEENLKTLYHEVMLDDVCLFLLENTQKPKIDGENIVIIDRDLCEIVV